MLLFRYFSTLLFVFIINNSYCSAGYLPPYIQPCEYNNGLEACIRKEIEKVLPMFTKGIPELDVPSIDPVRLDDVIVDGSGLKLTFTKPSMNGLSQVKVTQLKLTIGQNKEDFTLGFKGNLNLKGKYKADGRILILPIQGEGDSVIEATGVEVTIESKLMHVKDGKEEHLKLVTPTYKYKIDRTKFDLQNLFNGNKQLADTTLQFANENWQQLMDELAPPVIKQIVQTCVRNINKFFSKVTIPQIIHGYIQ